jgi:hypothetical protein
MDDNVSNGWVKVYHPSGLQVTLPVPADGKTVSAETAAAMLASVNNFLGAGWLVNLPGLEEGETKETVTHLVRRAKANDDGSETPLLDIYAGGNFRVVSVYLNDDDAVHEFVQAFGIALNALPVFDGTAPIERGKNPKHDASYVKAVTGAAVVWKLNPRYEGEQDKKHAKRMFVRWEKTTSPSPLLKERENPEPVVEGQVKTQAPAGMLGGIGPDGKWVDVNSTRGGTPINSTTGAMILTYGEYYKRAQDKRFNLTTAEARMIAQFSGLDINKVTHTTDFSRAFGFLPYFAEAKASGWDLDTSMSVLTAAGKDTARAIESLRKQTRA